MGTAKQMVFRYNGDPATEEHVADLRGEETIPTQGAIVERNRKHWKVVAVHKEETVTTPKAIPVYHISRSPMSAISLLTLQMAILFR